MAAWEQQIPVDITVEERHPIRLAQCRKKLKIETHVLIPESIPGMKKWSPLYYMDIAKYLNDKSLSDCLFHRLNCEDKYGKA